MFVGEAPGAEEDRRGLPFVGRAGGPPDRAAGRRSGCRGRTSSSPTFSMPAAGQPRPAPVEIETCHPYLFEQVRLIEPRVVCTLGNFATKLLTGNATGITQVRGTPQVHELGGRTVFLLPLLHPAAALRTPAVAETLRGDFRTFPELLDGPLPGARPARAAGRATRASRWRRAARPRPTSSGSSVERRAEALVTVFGRGDRGVGAADRRAASRPGDVVLVSGEVGRRQDDPDPRRLPRLGVEGPVTSPTFTIGRRYRGPDPCLAPRPVPAGEPGRRGPGPARRLPAARRGRLHRVAGGGGAAAAATNPGVSTTPAATGADRDRRPGWAAQLPLTASERPCPPARLLLSLLERLLSLLLRLGLLVVPASAPCPLLLRLVERLLALLLGLLISLLLCFRISLFALLICLFASVIALLTSSLLTPPRQRQRRRLPRRSPAPLRSPRPCARSCSTVLLSKAVLPARSRPGRNGLHPNRKAFLRPER